MLAGFILLFTLIAGCSSDKEPNAEEIVTLEFWDFEFDLHQEQFQKLVDEYNSIQDEVKIEYSSHGNSTDYSNQKLPVAFANEEGPDIFMTSAGDFNKYAKAGVMADLSDHFGEGIKEDFLPSTIEAVTYDEEILALPLEMELLGLFYNKKMLEEKNVKVPETWDELLDAAKKLKTDEVAGLVLPVDKGPYLNFLWYPFLWQNGGSVLNEDETEATFDSPEAAEALDFWGTFFKEGLAPSKLQEGAGDIDNITNGTAAMQVTGTWAIPALENEFKDFDAGLVPLPIPEGGTPATAGGGWKLAANANGEHIEEAADFIMWAFGEDSSRPLEWAKAKSAYPARISVLEEGEDHFQKGLREVFTNEVYDSAIPEPRYDAQIVDAVGEALQNVMFSDMSGKEAAEIADEKIQSLIEK